MIGATELRAALKSGDFSDETVAAALDAFREQEGLSYIDALNCVVTEYRAQLEAKTIARAARLLAKDSPLAWELVWRVWQYIGAPQEERGEVYVIAGRNPPTFLRWMDQSTDGAVQRAAAVGAGWLIEDAEEVHKDQIQQRWYDEFLVT